jgi:hypothetical protein
MLARTVLDVALYKVKITIEEVKMTETDIRTIIFLGKLNIYQINLARPLFKTH